ncbi:MAG: histidine kinase [Methylomarinum sp.]|nr:histidine kinase [Methylomarinum sp.]
MSLRYQISIRILIVSICILALGGAIAIWQARNAVTNEVDSSINLALQLIKMGLKDSKDNEIDWMYRLSALEQTRHLKIQLKKSSGAIVDITGHNKKVSDQQEIPPEWFVGLVISNYPKVEYQINTVDDNLITLIIQANPMDEITEVWDETIVFFSAILLLVLLTFLSVHFVFHKTLKSIQIIVDNLKGIERGEYQAKLADFSVKEYDSIAKAINHMTDALDDTQKQNKALTQHSLEIQEEERQRLSQELHDEFGQSLAAIKVMAVTVTHESTDIKKISRSIVDICDHLVTVVRSMMKQLHPLILTELGLKATLEDLLNHWAERTSTLSFTLHCDDAVDNMDGTITIQIYRVIQECLTNIVRHANASHAIVSLTIEADSLYLQVTDDGQGCHLDATSSGFGLLGMKERIKLLGGNFSVHSSPNEGVKINAQIPIL